jgi:hypothetical protein
MAICAICNAKIRFLDSATIVEGTVCTKCATETHKAPLRGSEEEQARQRKAIEARNEEAAKEVAAIVLTTGDLRQPYFVFDTLIALDSHEAEMFSDADPAMAFDGVKVQLRIKAHALSADAVICCQFEYRVAVEHGFFGSRQAIEIFAYGTAVKTKQISPDAGHRTPAPQSICD